MDTTFSFLGLRIYAYGMCAALAAALLLMGMKAVSCKLPKGTVSVFGVLAIPLGIAGARLLYCLCNLSAFLETYENPWLMLRFFDGGLSMPGLVGGLVAASAMTARLQKVCMADVLDAAAVPFGLSMAVLRLGERYTDLGVGKAVSEGFATQHLPWLFDVSRMGVAVEYRLNVWAYEAVFGLVIFAVALLMYGKFTKQSGHMALFVASLYGASQVLLESMRDDGHMLLIFLRVGQLGAALLPLCAIVILGRCVSCKHRAVAWVVAVVCIIGVALLEFSLDGRLTVGTPSLLRDYSLMAVCCAALFAAPCSMLLGKEGRA